MDLAYLLIRHAGQGGIKAFQLTQKQPDSTLLLGMLRGQSQV